MTYKPAVPAGILGPSTLKAELDSTDFSRTGNIGSLSEDRSRELKSGSESTNESNASGFESEALVPAGIAAHL